MSRVGIYPGTFDPMTRGHLDIIARSFRVVDRLIVAVAGNARKNPLFSKEERVRIADQDTTLLREKGYDIEVCAFDSLLIHFARQKGASVIIRGLRAVSDFEFEFQMTGMNSRLDGEIETLFLMASEKHQFISSRFVKEVASLGGDVSAFVTSQTLKCLHDVWS